MSFEVVTEEFEVRSEMSNNNKSVWAKGYAAFKGLDTYGTELSKKAMRKVAQDLRTKNIKIGIQHQKALGDRITNRLLEVRKRLISEDKSTKEIDEALEYNAASKLPIGKPRNISFDEEGVMVEVEINPHLKKLDPAYYNGIVGMLEDKFFDGFSIEFNNPKIHQKYDATGSRISVIEDLTVSGLSLVSGAANSGAQITDVFVRMAGTEKEEEIRMADEKEAKEKIEKLEKELKESKELSEATNKELSTIKDDLTSKEVALAEANKRIEDSSEDPSLREELDELKEIIKAQSKEGKLSNAKGIVNPEDKYVAQGAADDNKIENLRKELKEKPLRDLLKEAPMYK
ncbi:MAG: hypothetical protein U9O94_00165 [Nanoarchaeota archaeon]|nr:hypothetical protein [Nanoarchaeota archaeon]